MKIKLKNIALATVLPILAASGFVIGDMNSTSIELSELQFKDARNEIASTCWRQGGNLSWDEFQLFTVLADVQNKKDGGTKVQNFKGTNQERFTQYCKSMIRF